MLAEEFIVGLCFFCVSVNCLSIGRVNQTRFTSVISTNDNSIWLSNFSTWSECLCAIFSNDFSSTVAFNIYQNGSCQLFLTLPVTYRLERNINSTLILLKPLPDPDLAPCCSNLLWLMTRINASLAASVNITKPSFLIIDDNNFLVTLSYKGPLVQFNRTTLAHIQTQLIGSDATSLSYHNGFYYIPDCPSSGSCAIDVVSTKNLSTITSFPVDSTLAREITFVRNGSLMLVASNTQNKALFLDVNSIYNYTPSIPSSINITRPCGLHAVNDTFIYVSSWLNALPPTPVSTLQYSNNTWSLSPLVNTTPSINEAIFQTTVDSCGRLWLAVTGFGIRIFDQWGHLLLHQWPVSSGINGFHLTDNYELFVTNFTPGRILRFDPTIAQCTS